MQADMDMDMDMESSLYIYGPSGLEGSVNQQVFLASKGTSGVTGVHVPETCYRSNTRCYCRG